MMTWQSAAVVAAALLAGGFAMVRFARGARMRATAPFVREAGVILGLYALWQYAGGLSLGHTGDAVARGVRIWHIERWWHLPSEAWLQRGILGHPLLVQGANIYYATMHFGMLIAMLVWLYARHRDAYPRVRTTIVLTTTACLLVGLVPVAPPRLIHAGLVDTAVAYGQSVYAVGGISADQYSAMPSVHVAWAALVPIAVITASRSKWRWLILLHFAATVYVVVVTANHFWADGIVAVALLAISLALQAVMARLVHRLRLRPIESSGVVVALDESDDVGVH